MVARILKSRSRLNRAQPLTVVLLQSIGYYQYALPISYLHFFGAGMLRAQPYIQYGSDIEEDETITSTQTISLNKPILIQRVTVNGSGDWHVTSSHDASSPWGTHQEIVVRPETHFAPTGTHEVHLVAQN